MYRKRLLNNYFFINNIHTLILSVLFTLLPFLIIAQSKDSGHNSLIIQAQELFDKKENDSLVLFTDYHISQLKNQSILDSFSIAKLYFYSFEAKFVLQDYLESINSANLGLTYCPYNYKGEELKGMLYYKRAYGEGELRLFKKSCISMEQSAAVWANMENPNLDYLVGAYSFIARKEIYNGNKEKAERNLRLAEKVYEANKDTLDLMRTDLDGNYDRYEIILKYDKIYQIYKTGVTTTDSLALLQTLKELTDLHQQPTFNSLERIYYSTSLNHVGTWYLQYKPDSLISKADIDLGLKYIDQSIDLIENKGYPGNSFSFYFNKCKGLTYANRLAEAEQIIDTLLSNLVPTSGIRAFALAQKAFIKAKMGERETALGFFHTAIEQIHNSETPLQKNLSNFQPSEVYGETRLILRIIERLNALYKKDKDIQSLIKRLYYLALLQFENSYRGSQFNPKNNLDIRQIIRGLIGSVENNQAPPTFNFASLINRTETILNQIAWKEFYQSTSLSSLPELDALSREHLQLRKQLATAKLEQNIVHQDSIEDLIKNHLERSQKLYTNLDLLSYKNFDLNTLQEQLNPNELILKYFVLDQQLAIFQIRKYKITCELKSWKLEEEQLTQNFLESIKSLKYDQTLSNQLYEYLIPKFSQKTKKLIINTDGLLNQIPFEVLQNNNEYLIEQYNITYTSNLGFIHPYVKDRSTKEHLTIYVPEYLIPNKPIVSRNEPFALLGAKEEATAISRLFPTTIYSGAIATKAHFIQTAPKANLLHLAMHAVVNEEYPALSHLLFGSDQSEDQKLFLEELYAINLKANLAVLSACETGLGKEVPEGHMESIQRAFTFVGVPTTVASLWKVPDNTTKTIMKSFYKYLHEGDYKSVALQKAKQDYLQQTSQVQLKEPYYWAGFVIYGADGSVIKNKENLNKYLYLLGITSLILLLFYFLKRRLTS
ncbi:MAG: CHAT domain-containing protein [Bacteroidetes bacterium]|nr:CHAT domain-containing protein [Bacteroidota bacterium]